MALVLKDRVKETTTTTGTGTYTLAGASTGYQSFSVIGNGNTTYYSVTDGTNWEVGIGTYTASGTTLSRNTILESSNSGSAVNWGSGSKDIFCTYPAERAVDTSAISLYAQGTVSGTSLPSASNINAVSIGYNTLANGLASSVFGVQSNASGEVSTAIGYGAVASYYGAIAVGSATSSALYSTAIGYGAIANSNYQIAVGGFGAPVKISDVFTLPLSGGSSGQTLVSNGAGSTSFSTLGVNGGGTGITSGTSGGVPYYSASTTIASSAALAANALVIGGGAGAAPATTTTGTGVLTALGNNANAAGGFTTIDGTATLTNKRITQRCNAQTTTASPFAWNSDSYDQQSFSALANALTINADAGTPTDGQRAIFRIEDNGTARALTWTTGSSKAFRAIGVTLPTTTVINKTVYVGCIYNAADDRWDAVAVSQET